MTTPPCTEGVTWLVSTETLSISREAFERVRSVIGFNARFSQNELGEPNLLQVVGQAVPPAQEVASETVADDDTEQMAAMAAVMATWVPIPVPP